jgi:hypothetical protein
MESAAERKARLKALRAAAEESGVVPARDAGDECAPLCPGAAASAQPVQAPDARHASPCARRPPLKFRNYVPKDAELRAAKARLALSCVRAFDTADAHFCATQIEEAHAAELPEPVLEQPPPEDEDTQARIAAAARLRGCVRNGHAHG